MCFLFLMQITVRQNMFLFRRLDQKWRHYYWPEYSRYNFVMGCFSNYSMMYTDWLFHFYLVLPSAGPLHSSEHCMSVFLRAVQSNIQQYKALTYKSVVTVKAKPRKKRTRERTSRKRKNCFNSKINPIFSKVRVLISYRHFNIV